MKPLANSKETKVQHPFGMLMPGRSAISSKFRYGFNGKEQDTEVSGNGNHYDYGYRVYNPRLGRFLSTDPLAPDYPELTPYQFSSNTPIWAIDIDGLEAGYTISYNVYIDKFGNYSTDQIHDPVLTTKNGNWSGVKISNQFFYHGKFIGNSQGNVPGWNDWRNTQQEEFNKGAEAFAMGTISVLLAIPTGGSSIGFLAIGTGAASMGLGGFKLYQASAGKVNEYKNLPLGLGEAAGGFIGSQLGDEQLGQKIGGFGESVITGKGALKDLSASLINKDALKIVQGLQGLYEVGTSGWDAYNSIAAKIQSSLSQQNNESTSDGQ